MRTRYVAGLLCMLSASAVTAQEINIGAHLNPTVTKAFKGSSTYDKGLRISPAHIDINFGADVNLTFKKLRIETGINVVNKSFVITRQVLNFASMSYAKDMFRSTSIEVPVLLGYKLMTRQSRTYYHLYGVAGASYELLIPGSISQKAGSQGYSGTSVFNHIAESPSGTQHKANLIAGLHANAIVKRIGLIDYGFTWHMPLQTTGPYVVHSTYGASGGTIDYRGTMNPRMSYLNFKLCYYFLNLDRGLKVKRYAKS